MKLAAETEKSAIFEYGKNQAKLEFNHIGELYSPNL